MTSLYRPVEPEPRTQRLSWLTVGANLDPRYGGVSAVMYPLSRAVAATGDVALSLAAFCGPDENLSRITPAMARAETYALRGLRGLLGAPSAVLEQQIAAADGVHIHGLWQEHCALAARIARGQRKPYLISAHGMLDPWALRTKGWKKSLYLRLIENRNLRSAACLHALTPFEADTYRRLAPGVPVVTIPNGADVPSSADPETFLARFPQLRGRSLVLFLARIHPKKGLDILAEAWKPVSARWPHAHLVLAGPDFEDSRAALEVRIRNLGIADRVTFTGMLSGAEKWSALAAANLFVLPSYSEGLSVSVLEAMGMSRPVLVTEQCHVEGIAQHGCGWVIQPRACELEAALHEFFATPAALAQQMGSHGCHLVASTYQWRSIGARMAAVYRWLAGGPRPSEVSV